MTPVSDINEYVGAFKASPRMGDQVIYHMVLPERPADLAAPERPFPAPILEILSACGISRLYRHQALAVDRIRNGEHVVAATPTASGKTMIYNLPVLENILKNPASSALYLFPLKALAQDQLRTFTAMAGKSSALNRATAAIYDGDTSNWHRRRIRENPPNVLLTNPEMLHLSLLPYHAAWSGFLSHIDIVVIDEVHTYRGIMGSHMAQVFRRFRRICAHHGTSPVFVFSSATVANPAELAAELTGLDVAPITISGAPQGKKHLIFVDPNQGPARTAILLLKAALHRNLRTIVYAQSRKLTELIALWAGSRAGAFADRISPYRAGFLPEERREIEARLAGGDLLAVISTSALELGIDIGDLDLCLLVGYPGTIVAMWQRAGRVGRSGQDAAVVLIGGEDALDQYFMRHPLELVTREAEAAVINPWNPEILKRHLACAAAELPIEAGDALLAHDAARRAAAELEAGGELLRSADGGTLFSRNKAPHRNVDLRGTGSRYAIVCARTGAGKGEIDAFRAFRETHPGAVYIHNGETFLVETLDIGACTARIVQAKVDYYTRVRAAKTTEILEIYDRRTAWGAEVFTGRLKVTDQVTGYEKHQIHGRKKLSVIPLDLPPQVFETEGLWIAIPNWVQREAERERRHFMGGIHAVEHAAIGIFPLLVMTDRNDLGGISTPLHPQVGQAAVFIYDGVPGGAGLTRQAFRRAEGLLSATLKSITACTCESGCPSCVHSPKCGSGNRPIDKSAARFILEAIQSGPVAPTEPDPMQTSAPDGPAAAAKPPPSRGMVSAPKRFGVLDVETRRSADEVGGWHRADRMGVSCAVFYDAGADRFYDYLEDQIPDLVARLKTVDLVVGFNIRRFDYCVLGGLIDFDFTTLPTLDILEEVKSHLGYRLSLNHLAGATLEAEKTADGLQALRWWKEGRIQDIIAYCRMDVTVTRDLYLYGREKGYLLFRNKARQIVRIPVKW
ncbi:DEAD/DEAH box helicase [Desulfococcus sp.]|uniref:DEAD/DEAH box helicase n=1 Tax=Desulfococcus sp. TaxID=2025834 RepID=UPI003593F642